MNRDHGSRCKGTSVSRIWACQYTAVAALLFGGSEWNLGRAVLIHHRNDFNKSDREGEISYDIPYTWNLKRKDTSELRKQKDSLIGRTSVWLPGEGMVRKFGMDMHTLLYPKRMTSKDLLTSTWNSYMAAWMGGESGRERIHVYVWLSPFGVHLKLLQHC